VEIEIPPLRARGEDEVERLAAHFADTYAKRYRRPPPVFSPDALAVIRAHTWPGNVRELEHWVESAIVLSHDGHIGTAHLPSTRRAPAESGKGVVAAAGPSAVPLGLTLDEATRRYVSATLDACDGNKAEAARRLEIGRNTIARILKGDRSGLAANDDG
jgi:Nif-specific regulatory protein